MHITKVKQLSIIRFNRVNHHASVMNNSHVRDYVEQNILKYGNIKDQSGCVYGVHCDERETQIKAQYIFDKYATKELEGWHNTKERDEKKYKKEHSIKISCRELDEFYKAHE
ncbi:hypothetical protein [Methanimicrococcus blatticola]|uniref:Uncharacterized protein n=1 Tax=Methanimicrococcus blatticola TaxID=91560 RepID=A0A484F385_9EURY|nr:hypothetical protein [Methanimicrococcus blatticola]MBZ3935914.1 hypothetical protein [Methanimicrococcus blatticola]MCC2509473.1 hypothetical protein [Methanimicrococcus blatticola]TDQ68350.1 hypothetical protein C7391_1294 [Methanimicrococcus blatticola]